MHQSSQFLKYILFSLTIILGCQDELTSEQQAGQIERPNILLILTDDQGYGDVQAYGASDLLTPYLNGLIDDGMRFNQFYANCPVCSPTRAAILSGRYPELVGVPGVIRTNPLNSWGYMDPNCSLLPQILEQAGYQTSLIGKWHLGLESPNLPNERGFQYFYGWLGDMMDDYVIKRRHGINYMRENESEIDPEGHATDVFTSAAIHYLRNKRKEESPFFMYLAYNAPHFPVQPKEDWLNRVKEREEGISEKRAKLVAFIEHLDEGIGKLIEELKVLDLYDNTLIIFTSDNGGLLTDEADNGPLRDGKQSVYEGGIRVPAFAVWSGKIEASSINDQPWMTMDIFPTVLESAGIMPDSSIEGRSFMNVFSGKEVYDDNRPLFFSRREGGLRYGGKTIEAVRMGDWKLLQNDPFGPRELYNLKSDPDESDNLIQLETEKFKELNSLLMKHIQERGQIPWQKASLGSPASPK